MFIIFKFKLSLIRFQIRSTISKLRKELILFSLFTEIPPQRTGMISSLYFVDSLKDGIDKGCSSVIYFQSEEVENKVAMISFLKYKTSQSNCNANFTYALSPFLSNHITTYINEIKIIVDRSNVNKKKAKKRRNTRILESD